jgi:hypothetical protein
MEELNLMTREAVENAAEIKRNKKRVVEMAEQAEEILDKLIDRWNQEMSKPLFDMWHAILFCAVVIMGMVASYLFFRGRC